MILLGCEVERIDFNTYTVHKDGDLLGTVQRTTNGSFVNSNRLTAFTLRAAVAGLLEDDNKDKIFS